MPELPPIVTKAYDFTLWRLSLVKDFPRGVAVQSHGGVRRVCCGVAYGSGGALLSVTGMVTGRL